MFKNYIKVTLRNIRRDKWYSLINVLGLTIGITGAILIYMHISHELSYDNFHEDSDRLFRVVRSTNTVNETDDEPNVPYPFINSLNEDYLELEIATLYHSDDEPTIQFHDEKFRFDNGIFADSNFFEVFNYPVIVGDPQKALGQPNYVFLSEKTVERIFGKEDPLGQKLKLNNEIDLEVAGVFKDIPTNSHINFDFAVSYPSFSSKYFGGLDITSWSMSAAGYAYIKLNKNVTSSQFEERMAEVLKKYFSEQDHGRRKYFLQPLGDIHFNKRWNHNAVDETSLFAIGVIGAFILFLGCVNFINLSTALAVRKSKEVGVRKTLGAFNSQLLFQFLGETFIITLVSGILSIAIAERLIPVFNNFFDTKLELNVFENYSVLGFVFLVIFVVTVLAGAYPALVLSKFNAIKALKNNIHSQSSSSLFLRKGLITFQFLISQILIIATIVISYQMKYFLNKPLGYDKQGVVSIPIYKSDENKSEDLRSRLLQNHNIKEVSLALGPPTSTSRFETRYYLASQTEDDALQIEIKPADRFYKDTYNLNLLYGRWFTESDETIAVNSFKYDSLEKNIFFILNETAAKSLGFDDPSKALGEKIITGVGGIEAPIIGIVEDFHLGSLHNKIDPSAIVNFPMFYNNAGVKISMNNSQEAVAHIEKVYSEVFPESIFEYEFLDDGLREFYESEKQAHNLFMVFSGLSIFISCLGLLGMISFVVSQRTKEVGIRKVLGAKISSITLLFAKDFLMLVVIAFIIAAPIAWYFVDQWLSGFAYKIDLSLWYFVLAISISAFLTFLTIGYQSFKAAISNPVNALRNE